MDTTDGRRYMVFNFFNIVTPMNVLFCGIIANNNPTDLLYKIRERK